MTLVFSLLNLLYKPIFFLLIAAGGLATTAVLFTLIGQALFWAFGDSSGYSIAQFLGEREIRGVGELTGISLQFLLERQSHLMNMLYVLGFGVIAFILMTIAFAIQQFLAVRVTAGHMRRTRAWLEAGRLQDAHNWVVHNLNSQRRVERSIGRVDGHEVTAYENENRIKGYLRNTLLQMHEHLSAGDAESTIAVVDNWLKKPRL